MTALSDFTDFVNYTPPQYISSPDDFINDAIEQMPFFGRLMRNRPVTEMLQGGATIRDPIKLNVQTTLQRFTPSENFGGYQLRQSSTLGEIRWRFVRDHMSWTEAEVELNVPSGVSGSARTGVFKRIMKSKEQDMWTSIFNGLEDLWLADPQGAAFEDDVEEAQGTHPYPLYSLVNEETDRVPRNWDGTTVQGIDRNAEANYQNILNQYDYNDPDDADGDNDGFLDAMSATLHDLQFEPPQLSGTEQHFQRSGRDPRRMFIAASNGGMQFYQRRLLERNDTLAGASDPFFQSPKFAGVDVVQASRLGTAALYTPSTGNPGAAELDAATPGYRFYWIDGNFMVPVFHVRKFFERKSPFELQGQPDTMVQIVQVWYNIFLRSARRQGLVAPGA